MVSRKRSASVPRGSSMSFGSDVYGSTFNAYDPEFDSARKRVSAARSGSLRISAPSSRAAAPAARKRRAPVRARRGRTSAFNLYDSRAGSAGFLDSMINYQQKHSLRTAKRRPNHSARLAKRSHTVSVAAMRRLARTLAPPKMQFSKRVIEHYADMVTNFVSRMVGLAGEYTHARERRISPEALRRALHYEAKHKSAGFERPDARLVSRARSAVRGRLHRRKY